MADRKFIGAADPIAQVDTTQILTLDGTPANTVYKMTINGDSVSVPGDTDVNTTAANLHAALIASSNPYFNSITWTVLTDTITATALSAGNGHTIVSSVVGGTGTIGAVTNVTASSGPNSWAVPRNWDSGVVPITGDVVILENTDIDITQDLDQNAVTLAELIIRASFTGRLGLAERQFATTSDGGSTNPAKDEYKEQYLKIGATILTIGEDFTGRPQSGSTLVKVNLGSVLSTVTVHSTAGTAFEPAKPAVQLLGTHASNTLFVREATSSVGVAVGAFEASTFSDIEVGDDMSAGGVVMGPGVTITNFSCKSGTHNVNSAGTMTKLDALGGTVTTEGDYTITTANVGGNVSYFANHQKTGGVEIVTLNYLSAGVVDTTKSTKARTFTNVNLFAEAELINDKSNLTITNLNVPAGRYELAIAAV